MPQARTAANGLTTKQVAECSGLSVHMVNYLARHDYLVPHHDRVARSGAVRYYSYRDVIVARLIHRLLETGVPLKRVKAALALMHGSEFWERLGRQDTVALLVSNGSAIMMPQPNGTLLELPEGRQLAFGFLVNASEAQAEVLKRLSPLHRSNFSLKNEPLLFVEQSTVEPSMSRTPAREQA